VSMGELIPHVLGLRAGEWAEVRSESEILGTLDATGKLDGLPFMPEMLQFSGQRVRVFRRAEKTCDTIGPYASRRITNTVHLEGLRCEGTHHGGCQAGCFLFWKEAWLKRSPEPASAPADTPTSTPGSGAALLEMLTTRLDPTTPGAQVYVCQATELPGATAPLPWWDPRQYLRELRTGNVRLGAFVRSLALSWYNALQRRLGGWEYPYVAGKLERTPSRVLGLKPGERVRVRSRREILATLDTWRKNRGLRFDVEMVPYCGGEFRVLRRVTQIIEERTGRMIHLPGECVVLEGVTCRGYLSRKRLFCPRNIYPFWREIWLERVEVPE